MPFNRRRRSTLPSPRPSPRGRGERLPSSYVVYLLVTCVLCVSVMLSGCTEQVTNEDQVSAGARQRVAANVLGNLATESDAVFRNLTNVLAALPQICATPLARLGSFTSALAALGRPQSVMLVGEDDEDTEEAIFFGSWTLVWKDVVPGADGGALTDTPPVDITLNVRPRTAGQGTLLTVPFTLVPQSAPLATATAGQPATLPDTEGFFLFQDTTTGVWTLRWRALGTPKVFDGTISGVMVSRVMRRVTGRPQDIVESLEVELSGSVITFREMTALGDEKGFTFFVRPGELPRFELRIGDTEDDLQPITPTQLHIGSGDRPAPPGEDPGEFRLATNLPMDPVGAPTFTAGADLGTFIWQDVEQNTCNVGEDQWRVRLSTDGASTLFDGNVTVLEDDTSAALTFTAIGGCQGDLGNGEQSLDYTCTLAGDQVGGYDICVTAGHRVVFISAVNELRDPGLVFVGRERQPPPSPDPFSIVFDIDLQERQTGRNLSLADAQIVLSGNNPLDGVVRINPDQLSLEPLCGRLPKEIEAIVRREVALAFAPGDDLIQPRVRLTGNGTYSSSRFDGSLYLLQEVEFLTPAVRTLDTVARFPDRGRIVLQTRLQDEVENTTITAEAEDIAADAAGHVTVPVKMEVNLSRVIFEFEFDPNDPSACPPSDADEKSPCIMDLTAE